MPTLPSGSEHGKAGLLMYQISEETRRKAEIPRREAERLVERELKCPECGYKAGTVFRTAQDI